MEQRDARVTIALLAGLLAPLLYAAAVLVGGFLTPGYSHFADPISALIQVEAPAKTIIDALFVAYNLLIMLFAVAIPPASSQQDARISLVSPAGLGVIGVLGLLMWPLPMDPIGAASTARGITHIGLAALQSVCTIATVMASALSLWRYPAWRSFSVYSGITLALLIASGAFAAWSAASLAPFMGLAERVTIGIFLQWVFVFAIRLSAPRQ